jgi:hypothetical protein
VDSLTGAPQLLPRSVDLESPEAKIQNIPHPQSWFPPRHGRAGAGPWFAGSLETSGTGRGSVLCS